MSVLCWIIIGGGRSCSTTGSRYRLDGITSRAMTMRRTTGLEKGRFGEGMVVFLSSWHSSNTDSRGKLLLHRWALATASASASTAADAAAAWMDVSHHNSV